MQYDPIVARALIRVVNASGEIVITKSPYFHYENWVIEITDENSKVIASIKGLFSSAQLAATFVDNALSSFKTIGRAKIQQVSDERSEVKIKYSYQAA
jgi:hypothetical protein